MHDVSPVEVLLQDHAAARELLNALAADTTDLAPAEWATAPERIGGRFAALRDLLLLHFRREEEAAYPDIMQMVSEGAPEADIVAGFFRQETDADLIAHAPLRGKMQVISQMLADLRRGEGDLALLAQELGEEMECMRDLLNRHAEREETVIFPMIERLLSEEQLTAVRLRMDAIGSEA